MDSVKLLGRESWRSYTHKNEWDWRNIFNFEAQTKLSQSLFFMKIYLSIAIRYRNALKIKMVQHINSIYIEMNLNMPCFPIRCPYVLWASERVRHSIACISPSEFYSHHLSCFSWFKLYMTRIYSSQCFIEHWIWHGWQYDIWYYCPISSVLTYAQKLNVVFFFGAANGKGAAIVLAHTW